MFFKRSGADLSHLLHTHWRWRCQVAIRASLACLILVSIGACQPDAPVFRPAAQVSSDPDAHGCQDSAGHVWSGVHQRCLRLFEEALAFEPHADNPDQNLKAFVVLAPAAGRPRQAEVFLPHNRQALTLEVVKPPADDIRPVVLRNPSERIEVVRVKDMYVLRVKEQVLFTHDAVAGSPLGRI